MYIQVWLVIVTFCVAATLVTPPLNYELIELNYPFLASMAPPLSPPPPSRKVARKKLTPIGKA